VSLLFKEVTVRATGHTILQGFSLKIDAGSHICIVGASGAGKSTLIGLLLGWHRPSAGTIEVDGLPLDDAALESLRRDTAWVEPNVQLWNRSLVENLQYGLESSSRLAPIGHVIEEADLRGLLTSLPDGLQSRLGEGGALVSGGEGQRVRLGRAMLRPSSRLVVLDEPFTALDREARRRLLMRARSMWKRATLLCVTHDVSDSTEFERVIVMGEGRIVEDDSPAELIHRSESRYRKLLEADRAVRGQVWANRSWRTLHLENGQLTETTYSRDDDEHSRDMLAHSTAERDPCVVGGTGWVSSKAS
jgi:ATP-binding cassette subfamily B protein